MDSALENQRETEWDTGDLYEKQRVRKRRRLFLILGGVFLLFLVLCSVPVIQERSPKWKSLRSARRLAIQLEHLKTLAIQKKKALHLKISEQGEILLLESAQCGDPSPQQIEKLAWIDPEQMRGLPTSEASALDLRWVVNEICFDPVYGLKFEGDQTRSIFVLVPVKDLTEKRLDRASYVVLDGHSAKISIN